MTAQLMKNPDFTRTFVLQTDASGVKVGAVLSQGEEEDQPIASQAVTSREILFYSREGVSCHCFSSEELQSLLVGMLIHHSNRPQSTTIVKPVQREERKTNKMKPDSTTLQLYSAALQTTSQCKRRCPL